MRSFDTVSIDSDLDTVCTERVRQHINKWTGGTLQEMGRNISLISLKGKHFYIVKYYNWKPKDEG